MLFKKKNVKKNIYSDCLKADSKSNNMKKLFDSSNHAGIAASTCASNRIIQNIAAKK